MTPEWRAEASRWLWAALLVLLPVTSFRYIPLLGQGTFVRPLAIYPLALLLPLLLLRLALGEIKTAFPKATILPGLLLVVLITSSVLGAIDPPIPLGGTDYFDRSSRALLTVAIGYSFLLAAMWSNRSARDVLFSIKVLMVGLAISIVWAAVQFYGLNHGWRSALNEIQTSFSVRGLVKNKRVSGFAYEPSWLAGQLATIYIPWLFAAILHPVQLWGRKFVAHRHLPFLKTDMLVLVLFVGSLATLFFTYSRSGLLMGFASIGITYLFTQGNAIRTGLAWFREGFGFQPGQTARSITGLALRLSLVVIILAAAVGAGLFLADKGYIVAFVDTNAENLADYLQNAYLGPRAAYLQAALAAFSDDPLFGSGLGASGFWIYQNIPDWALAGNPEISRQMSPDGSIFPNPKNMIVRLLAETGIAGFSIYCVFIFYMLYLANKVRKSTQQGDGTFWKWFGVSAFSSLISIAILGFSQDSFAMPELWLVPGILIGVYNSNKN